MGWKNDSVNTYFHSQNKDHLKARRKPKWSEREREYMVSKFKLKMAEDDPSDLENDPRWNKKEWRTSY